MRKVIDIDLIRCLECLKKNIFNIVIVVVLGMLLGEVGFVLLEEPENAYTAEATVYAFASGSSAVSEEGIYVIRTYSEIIKSLRIAQRAAVLLDIPDVTGEDIYDMISTDSLVFQGTTYVYEDKSSVIHIYAESEDKELAIAVVNAVANAFIDEINRMSSVDSAFAHVLDHAADAEKTYNALKTQILYMALGGVGLAFVYAACLMGMVILSPRMATVKDATLYGQLDVIGVIPAIEERPAYVREKDKTYGAVP